MCGRYTITVDKSTIEKRFSARFYIAQAEYAPTYNAAPSHMLPVMRRSGVIELARWGFIPETWSSSRIRPQNNARFETANDKPMFSSSFRARHCLVIADSFYEWKETPRGKQPYRIMLKSGEPFAMAGIYARIENYRFAEAEGGMVSFAILTTASNEIMRPIHDRMPVILPLGREQSWLPATPSGAVSIPEFPAELMTAYPVTKKVNKVAFNEPEAIRPIEPVIQLSL